MHADFYLNNIIGGKFKGSKKIYQLIHKKKIKLQYFMGFFVNTFSIKLRTYIESNNHIMNIIIESFLIAHES